MNLKIIDPNKISDGGFSTQMEDLCIDLQLTAIKKGETLIIAEGKAFDTDQEKERSVDLLQGQNFGGSQYLSTLFTEIGSQYDTLDDDGSFKNFETLGITSVDIEFNSSNVPVVKMTMTDVRGRLFQQGNNSPYNLFFEFPYPMFRFRAKGFYGKTVKYDLHLLKFNTQFNSDNGGFEITCEFIGFTYAYLSDLLIGYIRAAPYTTVGSELVSNVGKSFQDYQDEAFKLAEMVKELSHSSVNTLLEEQKAGYDKLSNLKEVVDLEIKKLSEKEVKRNIYSSDKGYYVVTQNSDKDNERDGGELRNLQDLFHQKITQDQSYGGKKINFKLTYNINISVKESPEKFMMEIKEINKGNETIINLFQNAVDNEIGKSSKKNVKFTFIDISETFKVIDEVLSTLKNDIILNEEAKVEEFTSSLSSSELTPTIGEYFKLICNHSDLLWASIHKVAENVLNDTNRKSQFKDLTFVGGDNDSVEHKILPFPDFKKKEGDMYVDDWIGNAAADGATIPEAKFVEELIKGFLKAYQELKNLNEKLNNFEQATELNELQTGSLTYIPIHPSDSPIGGSDATNPYSNVNDYSKLINRISNRILAFFSTQIIDENIKVSLDKDVINKLAEIEVFNINSYINNNSSLCNLLNTNSSDTGLETEILGISADEGMKSKLVSDISSIISKKVKLITGKKGMVRYNPVLEDNGDDLATFKPNGVKVGYYVSYHKDGNIKRFGDKNKGEFVYIHNSEDINSMSLGKTDIVLDETNSGSYSNNKNFSKQFGPFYFEKFTTNKGEIMDGALMFYSPKAIKHNKKIFSYFSPNTAPTNINGFKITNYKLNDFSSEKDKKSIILNEQILQTSFIKGLSSNDGYLSDIPMIIEGRYSSLFMSAFYQYQTSKTKAFLLLHALPFKYKDDAFFNENLNDSNKFNSSTYFDNDILNLFRYRSGIVKSSYAWAALIGGLCEFYDNKNTNKDFRIIFKGNNVWYLEGRKYSNYFTYANGDNKTLFLKHNCTLVTDSSKFFKDNGIGLVFGSTSSGDRKFGEMPKFITEMPTSAKEHFKTIFNDFVNYFIEYIEPNTKIFGPRPNFNLITKSLVDNNSIDFSIFGTTSNVMEQYNFFNISSHYSNNYDIGNSIYGTAYNICRFKKDSKINTELVNLINRNIFISVLNPSMFKVNNNIADLGVTHQISSKDIHTFLKSFNTNINSLTPNSIIGNELKEMAELKESIGLNETDDIRIKVYKDIKSIYEKWVNGDSPLKNLYQKFKFQNRHYKDIANEFKINPLNLIKDLTDNLHQPLISHISKVLSENNFNFLPTPSYIDIHDYSEMKDLFKPYRWVDSIDTAESMFVCMYIGEYSSKLDVNKNGNYQNDGITLGINDFATIPEITDITASDFLTDKDIPIIRVKFGDQQQSIFKKFGLDQTEFTISNESLIVTDSLTQKNGLSQNLFDVYLSRSYTLNLEMLGNFMIQPFMYLYLENIPMFYGLYYIIKVSHKVSANSVTTTVKAVRMRQTMTKMLDDKTLYNNLLSTYQDSQIDGSGIINNGFSSVNTNYLYDLITSEVVNTDTLHVSSNDEVWLLRETHEFILDVSKEWMRFNEVNKKYGKMLVYTAGSLKGGGKSKKHSSHQKGVDIDLRVLKDGYESWTSGGDSSTGDYSREAFFKLLEILKKVGSLPKYSQLVGGKNFFELIGFTIPDVNDPQVKTNWKNHYNHYHIRVRVPYYITDNINKREIGPTGVYPGGNGLPTVDTSDVIVGKGERVRKLQSSLGLPQTGEFNQETFTKWRTKNGLTREQACHVLGQMAEETDWFTVGTESLNYKTKEKILEIFGSRISTSEASNFIGKPVQLANRVYGTINGNRPGTNDGYNYIGRGGIQISGRDSYKSFGDFIGKDLINNPELINSDYYFDTGVYYFKNKNKKVLQAASVMSDDAIIKVSKGVNLGSITHPKTPLKLDGRRKCTMWFYNKFK